jgi:ABC-type lipoprotein release transport system permease subunit
MDIRQEVKSNACQMQPRAQYDVTARPPSSLDLLEICTAVSFMEGLCAFASFAPLRQAVAAVAGPDD